MSRCFPFPPPGYERKPTLDDGNLLVKEKDKEKKEKKQRKDKEKKEGKEKDKERSKDKHREQDKEKKEKHKHKDKDKKKDKKRSRDEKSDLGESSKAEKAGSNSPQYTDWKGVSSAQELGRRLSYGEGAVGSHSVNNSICADQASVGFSDNTKNSVWSGGKDGVHQLSSGQRDVDRTKLSKVTIISNVNGADQSRRESVRPMPKESYGPTERKEMEAQHYESDSKGDRSKTFDQRILEREMDHGVVVDPPKEAAFVQELGRRIRYDNGSSGSQVVAKAKSANQTRAEFVSKVASGNVDTFSVAKQTSKIRNGNQRMELGQREIVESGDPNVANVHSFKELEQRGREMVGPAEMGKKLPFKGAERNGYGEGGALSSKEKSFPIKMEDSNRAQTEKGKQGGEFIIKLSRLGERSNGSSDSSKLSIKSTEGVGRKRKEREANSIVLDSEVQPNKVPRTTITLSTSKQSPGYSKLGSCAHINGTSNQKSPLGSSTAHGSVLVSAKPPSSAVITHGVVVAPDSTIGLRNAAPGASSEVTASHGFLPSSVKPSPSAARVNGKTVAEEDSTNVTKPPPAMVIADGTMAVHAPALGCTKPPSDSAKSKRKEKSSSKSRSHRDVKYLSDILSVPKIDEWCEFDDQDWLFSNGPSKVTKSGSTSEDVEMQVWSKAVHIAPADVYALPYVIPY